MISRKNWLAASCCAALALGAAACGDSDDASTGGSSGDTESNLSGQLNGAGASSQEAAVQAWTVGFQDANPDVTVSYDPVGSGGGREQFAAGGIPFAGSDAALEGSELKDSQDRCGGPDNLVEVPVYISPIAVAYNLEGVDELNLSPETLAGIMAGDITEWSDEAIASDNPDADLPDEMIVTVHRSDESGTTENFVDFMSQTAPDAWDFPVDGNWPVKGGEAAQGTSGVIDAIGAGSGTIGYADLSQVGDLNAANIGVGEDFVEPSSEAAAQILEDSEEAGDPGENVFSFELNRKTEDEGIYPISLVSYDLACTEYDSQDDADLTRGFISYVISEDGQAAAADAAGSAAIPSSLRDKIMPAVEAIGGGG